MLGAILLPAIVGLQAAPGDKALWRFVNETDGAGLTSSHGYIDPNPSESQMVAGGVAAGDYDGDGHVDLYLVAGNAGANMLFRNQGNGTFIDIAARSGVAVQGRSGSGPLFFDFDGDGRLDLFVGAVEGDAPALFHNQGDGTFADVTAESGLTFPFNTISATAGDFDGDGWLDLFLSHWGATSDGCHLWRNTARGRFECADSQAGLEGLVRGLTDRTFTANFADLDGDSFPDLLVSADHGQTTVWHNSGAAAFVNQTDFAISDENGMGSAVGDFDGDGHLDWFVSSIRDSDGTLEGNWGGSGNRLYRNRGDGTFADATDATGVRDGDWGWAAAFADFNNDGHLDLVHVNGWPRGSGQFRGTPARLFVGSGGGTFLEEGIARGFDERVGGRGLVCFDYDGDGDLDLFVANNSGSHRLWRNDGGRASGHFLTVTVIGTPPNILAVGATVQVTAGGRQQTKQVQAGSNYVSQNPLSLHFGLDESTYVDHIRVVWPDGRQAILSGVKADKNLQVSPSDGTRQAASSGGCSLGHM